jgi:hypothetical protein
MKKCCIALCLFAFFLITPSANALSILSYVTTIDPEATPLSKNIYSEWQAGTNEINYSASVDLVHFDVATLMTPTSKLEYLSDLLKGAGFDIALDFVTGESTEAAFIYQIDFKLLGSEGERAVMDFSLEGSSESTSYFGGTAGTMASGILAGAGVRLNQYDDSFDAFEYLDVDQYTTTYFGALYKDEHLSLDTKYSWEMEVGDSGTIFGRFDSGVSADLPFINAGFALTKASNTFNWTLKATGLPPDTDPVVAPVPEPATILLLGSGLAGLVFYRRKKK